jgi:hypothetical protein
MSFYLTPGIVILVHLQVFFLSALSCITFQTLRTLIRSLKPSLLVWSISFQSFPVYFGIRLGKSSAAHVETFFKKVARKKIAALLIPYLY